MPKRYADLHVHPGLKPYMTVSPQPAIDLWSWVEFNVPLAVNILGSQANLNQQIDSDFKFLVYSIVPLERAMARFYLLDSVIPGVVVGVNEELIEQVKENKKTYFDQFCEEMAVLLHADYDREGPGKFNFPKQADQFDHNKTNVIFSMEGAYGLITEPGDTDGALARLEQIKTGTSDERIDGARLLYLTMVHYGRLSDRLNMQICTHAFIGYKMACWKLKDPDFQPINKGITEFGKELIELAYRNNPGEYRIFIDIKHMSVYSRKELYEFRKKKGFERIPLLATHVGVTGFRLKDILDVVNDNKICKITGDPATNQPQDRSVRPDVIRVQYRKKMVKGKIKYGGYRVTLSPLSLGLCDEDIIKIIESGGMIGIILEKSRLGIGAKKAIKRRENFSIEEFKEVFGYSPDKIHDDFVEIDWEAEDEEIEKLNNEADLEQAELEDDLLIEEKGLPGGSKFISNLRGFRHFLHFLENLLHILWVWENSHPDRKYMDAARQVCIGSDMDGFIQPIASCKDITEYGELEEELKLNLKKFAVKYFDLPIQNKEVKIIIDGVMGKNLEEFLNAHFV